MITLSKEKRQDINQAVKDLGDGASTIYEFTRRVLEACGIEEDVGKEDPEVYDPYCDDPECQSCNGIGADGHHY